MEVFPRAKKEILILYILLLSSFLSISVLQKSSFIKIILKKKKIIIIVPFECSIGTRVFLVLFYYLFIFRFLKTRFFIFRT